MFAEVYGINSQGDDAALIALLPYIKQRIGDFQGTVLVRHKSTQAYDQYGLRTIKNFEYETKAEFIDKWFNGFNFADDSSELKALFDEVGRSDMLVLGAGNFLIDQSIRLLRGPVPHFALLTMMAKIQKRPVMWFGMSVGRLT